MSLWCFWSTYFVSPKMQTAFEKVQVKPKRMLLSQSVWPGVGVKKLPKHFQKLPNNIDIIFYSNWSFSKQSRSHQSDWAIAVNKFVDKNTQKSPNLVTLLSLINIPRRERKIKVWMTSLLDYLQILVFFDFLNSKSFRNIFIMQKFRQGIVS